MSIELDEVYVASIKEMFKEFDDEIIWTAIFEHGYQSDGTYNLENVVNYLLELTQDNTKHSTSIEDSKNTNENNKNTNNNNSSNNSEENNKKKSKFTIPSSNIEENSNLLDNLEEDMEEAQIIEPSFYQNIVDLISNNNNGYKKIEDN